MIKVSVFYPNTDGSRFNYNYYYDTHIELIKEKAGPAIKGLTVDRGLSGGEPDSKPPFHAVFNVLFDSLESFSESFVPHVPEFLADVPNYYDAEPIVQISEVKEF